MVSTTRVRQAGAQNPNGTERHHVAVQDLHPPPTAPDTDGASERIGHAVTDDPEDVSARFERLGLIGCSPALRRVCQQIIHASQCTQPALPVLITGETGVGKELVARAIHTCDPRRKDHPLVAVPCGTLTQDMAPSLLFGHIRGAFSGAMSNHDGYFLAADRGTIQLDDVEALGPSIQPMLLRVLAEHRVVSIGTTTPRAVNVRVIATTNASLPDLALKNNFRLDLYYRLCGCEIVIPPLRDRPEDIEPQARHFLWEHQRQSNKGVSDIAPAVLELFRRLPWQGNSRELSHVIWEALSGKENGSTLDLSDLPPKFFPRTILASSSPATLPLSSALQTEGDPKSLAEVKETAEVQRIKEALAKHKNNRLRAAAELGISRMGLYKRLRKYGLTTRQPA